MIIDQEVYENKLVDFDTMDFLDHHGVKGQKWGVRQQRRLNTAKRVASGKGSFVDKVKLRSTQSVVSNLAGGSSKRLANKTVVSLEARKKRMNAGRATTMDILDKMGFVRLNTL